MTSRPDRRVYSICGQPFAILIPESVEVAESDRLCHDCLRLHRPPTQPNPLRRSHSFATSATMPAKEARGMESWVIALVVALVNVVGGGLSSSGWCARSTPSGALSRHRRRR